MFGYGATCVLLSTTARVATGENPAKRVRSIRARYMRRVAAQKVERYGYDRMAAVKPHRKGSS